MPKNAYDAFDSAGRRKYLTPTEGKHFLKAASRLPTRERLLCQTLYYVGCRVSEAVGLMGGDIDAAEGIVQVLTLKKRQKHHVRRVPVPKRFARELVRLNSANEPIWPISRMTAWRIVKAVMVEAQISGPQACCKGLRHGFAVRSVLAKIPIHLVQRWLGHSSITSTLIYLSIVGPEERNLIARTWV